MKSAGFVVGAGLWLGAVAGLAQVPVGTEFSYQGRLLAGGSAASGPHDLQFSLFDAESGGVQVGGTICVDDVHIVDGLFSVELDFGAGMFNGNARWIEIAVRTDNTPGNCAAGLYAVLAPRQPLSAAPYALYALGGPGGGGGFWSASGTSIFNNNAGGVGVGTSAPDSLLHVSDGSAGAVTAYSHSTATFERDTYSYVSILSPDETERGVLFGDPESNVNGGIIFNNTSVPDGFQFRTGGNATRMVITDVGNVGIGTSSPQRRLDISAPAARISSTSGPHLELKGPSSGLSFTIGAVDFIDGNDVLAGGVTYLRSIIGDRLWLRTGGADQVAIDQDGRVGIGTGTPEGKLQVAGGTDTAPAGGGYLILGSQDGTNLSLDNNEIMARSAGAVSRLSLNADGGDVTISQSSSTGRLAIGLTNPSARLHVTASGEQTAQFNQLGTQPGVVISSLSGTTNFSALSVTGFSDNAPAANITTAGDAPALQVISNGGGPALNVVGTARTDVLEITGADLAERFPTSEPDDEIEPGMVMAIDPTSPGKLCVARGAYNTCVVGVVSGAGDIPIGAILGNLPGHEAAPAIALSGRVYVRCDARERAIQPGDLLTTSETAGHAMRAVDTERARGAILGKAMTPLAAGERGLVLVLVSLQ